MTADEADVYVADLDEPKRSTLDQFRQTILSIVPDAEQGLSYGAPAFKLGGKAVAGFSASKSHLSYLPHSGTVLESLDPGLLADYEFSKGALKFPVDEPLPKSLVEQLIAVRRQEIDR